MKRNTDLDFIRAILILLMILIHIVSFGNAYPHIKAGILSFMMPTFLIITGYLVNIEKTPRQMGRYLMCLILPYVIMVTGFSVLSYFMPVRDGITELSLQQICERIFVTSISPYWFIQTMIICGVLYYCAFIGRFRSHLQRKGKSVYTSLFIFAILLAIASRHPALSPSAAAYYFIGVAIRQCQTDWGKMFRAEPMAMILWAFLLCQKDWYSWGSIAVVFSCWCCISTFTWIRKFTTKIDSTLLYIGRNTLPIYLFHPIFTMAAKYYHPLFAWDRSEVAFAAFTVMLAVAGSLAIAKAMELSKMAYVFGKGNMLR